MKACLQADKLKIPVVGWVGDEMEIRAGLTYLKHFGLIVGTTGAPIQENKVSTVVEADIPARLAKKIMMVHLTTVDGSATIPLIHYPTATATAQFMSEKVLI